MINYDPELEKFQDHVDFGPGDPCIWIVYPAGAAGDLLSSIINYHFVNTGARYYGVDQNGQTIFRPTDYKLTNLLEKMGKLEFNTEFFYKIADSLSSRNLNYSLLDQVLFSNHCWQDSRVKQIIESFPKAKIIRIIPRTQVELDTITWLSNYKNLQKSMPIPDINYTTINLTAYSHPQLLDVQFLNLFDSQTFDITYNEIVKFLNLAGPLIRFDFIKFWLDKQPPAIKQVIQKII